MKQLIMICLCLITIQGFAQKRDGEYKKLKLGLLLTPQLSWLKPDHAGISNGGVVGGISYGLLGDYFFAENYAISVGLLQSHTGGKLTYGNGVNAMLNLDHAFVAIGPNETIRYALTYIEVPVGLKLKTKLFRRTLYYGQLGLTPMFKTKATAQNGKNLIKEVQIGDLGYHFGGGVEYSLGGETFLHLALFYTSGLIDVTTNSDIDDVTHLNAVNLRVGINF